MFRSLSRVAGEVTSTISSGRTPSTGTLKELRPFPVRRQAKDYRDVGTVIAHAGNPPLDQVIDQDQGIGSAGQDDLKYVEQVNAIQNVRGILGHVIFQLRMKDVLLGERHHDERLPAAGIGAGHVAIAVAKGIGLANDVHRHLAVKKRISFPQPAL